MSAKWSPHPQVVKSMRLRRSMYQRPVLALFSFCFRSTRRGTLALPLQPARTSTMSHDASIPTKPPNVLVLSAGRGATTRGAETDAGFLSIKEGITACLNEERYVVYPLRLEDVVRAPWRDNCRLLVVPSGLHLEEGVDDLHGELEAYIQGGGTLFSIHPVINAAFGFRIPEYLQQSMFVSVAPGADNMLKIDPEEWMVAHMCTAGDSDMVGPDTFQKLPQQKSSKVLATMKQVVFKNIDETKREDDGVGEGRETDCIQHLQFEGPSGQAILSYVDLLATSGPHTNISELLAIKQDAEKVSALLQTVLRELGMECTKGESSSPTLSYLVCSDQLRERFCSTMALLMKDDVIKGSEVDIELVTTDVSKEGSSVDPLPIPTVNKIVLLTSPSEVQLREEVEFDVPQYIRWLCTGFLGRTLLYTPVIGSTQTMLTGNTAFSMALKPNMGVVCAAGQQTKGIGRHGNVWLSPKGCMMFSAPLTIQPGSRLNGRLSLLQHIVALSVVTAIRSIPGYEELPVYVKWPNDIYYQSQVKLGGVLVTTYSSGSSSTPTTAIIGCGVNVCNKYPTMAVNDVIQLHNAGRNGDIILPLLTVEALLALTLNQLERYIGLCEQSGLAAFEKEYYHYWLHSGAVVQLGCRDNEEATVTGIDEYGYLCVRTHNTREELTLQPDGNSFDITRNLIVMK